jgi:hypothetical protein
MTQKSSAKLEKILTDLQFLLDSIFNRIERLLHPMSDAGKDLLVKYFSGWDGNPMTDKPYRFVPSSNGLSQNSTQGLTEAGNGPEWRIRLPLGGDRRSIRGFRADYNPR